MTSTSYTLSPSDWRRFLHGSPNAGFAFAEVLGPGSAESQHRPVHPEPDDALRRPRRPAAGQSRVVGARIGGQSSSMPCVVAI